MNPNDNPEDEEWITMAIIILGAALVIGVIGGFVVAGLLSQCSHI